MRRLTLPLIVIVLLGAGVFLHQPLRRMLLTIFRLPLSVTESLLGTLLELPHLPSVVHDTAALRSELTVRQLEAARLREAVRHLTRSKELNRAFEQTSGQVASIIGRTMIPTQHLVVLDRGSRDGVVRESALLDVAGVVGRVIEVHSTTSLAMLVTDPNSRIACLVERSRESGLLVGTGESLCRLLYLDLDADLVVTDRVVTAGLGGPFPKGIVLGMVVKVVRDERHARLTAWVRPAVKLNQLEEVLCLPPSKESIVHGFNMR